MKKYNPIKLLLLVGTVALCLASSAHAQSDVQPLPAEAQNALLALFTTVAAKYPVLATLVGLMGSMRFWAKPAFSVVHQIVDLTPSKTDDGWYDKIHSFLTNTGTGRTLAYALDWLTSIKLVPPAKDPAK